MKMTKNYTMIENKKVSPFLTEVTKYTIIKDARMLKGICKEFGMEYDEDYRYITNDGALTFGSKFYKNETYKLKYFSGCFYPYLIRIDDARKEAIVWRMI